ncbi:MAG: hypothetical protein WC708_20160 [Lentisphaeria bacterium]
MLSSKEKLVVAILSVLVMAGLASLVTPADAGIIYYDTFTAADYSKLNGHTPNITTNGASWLGTGDILGGWARDGVAGQSAYLPFTPASDTVYTLSAVLKAPGTATNQWIACGFSTTPDLASQGVAWFTVTTLGKALARPGGPTFDIEVGSTHTYTMTLDTTNATTWTANWYFDQEAAPYYTKTYTASTTTISYLTLYWMRPQSGWAIGCDTLTLSSSPVPEPTALVFLGLGGLLLAGGRARQRRP